jgi:hypothetical protein
VIGDQSVVGPASQEPKSLFGSARRLDRVGDDREAAVVWQCQTFPGQREVADNRTSVAGRTARAGNGVYAATKWGINGWSESLRQELLPDVRVTVIEPGAVATELPTHITHEATRQGAEQLYSQVEVTAEDVAEVIAFALSRARHLAVHEIPLRPAGQKLQHPRQAESMAQTTF